MSKKSKTATDQVTKAKKVKKRSKERTIMNLLNAGLEVFSKFGFESSTTKQVAKCAGINEALIARYFSNKAGLLQAIILNYVQGFQIDVGNYPPGQTLEGEIQNSLRHSLLKIQENRHLNRIILSRALVDPKLSRDLEKFFAVDANGVLLMRLKHFQDKKSIAADRNLTIIAQNLHTHALGLFLLNATTERLDHELVSSSIAELAHDFALALKQPYNSNAE